MKKILCFILAAALALCCCACSGTPKTDYSQYGDSAVIEASKVTAKAGGTVDVTISLNNNPGAAAIGIELDYDTAALTPIKAKTVGKLIGNGFFISNVESEADSTLADAGISTDSIVGSSKGAKMVWFYTENYTADGDIMVVTFQVAADAKGEYPINFVEKDDDLVNVEQQSIADKVYLAGSVTVG